MEKCKHDMAHRSSPLAHQKVIPGLRDTAHSILEEGAFPQHSAVKNAITGLPQKCTTSYISMNYCTVRLQVRVVVRVSYNVWNNDS